MVARLLFFSLVPGLLILVAVGLASSHEARAVAFHGDVSAAQVRQAGDRRAVLLGHTKTVAAGLRDRRRPAAMRAPHGGPYPGSADSRAGARKAVPVTRGQELGLRFRPDERESPYGEVVVPPAGGGSDLYSPELQSQFRPMQKKRKPTYEELQAESLPPQPTLPAPVMPYPMITPPPMPGYGPGWPGW